VFELVQKVSQMFLQVLSPHATAIKKGVTPNSLENIPWGIIFLHTDGARKESLPSIILVKLNEVFLVFCSWLNQGRCPCFEIYYIYYIYYNTKQRDEKYKFWNLHHQENWLGCMCLCVSVFLSFFLVWFFFFLDDKCLKIDYSYLAWHECKIVISFFSLSSSQVKLMKISKILILVAKHVCVSNPEKRELSWIYDSQSVLQTPLLVLGP
jgi:hypothetical protein